MTKSIATPDDPLSCPDCGLKNVRNLGNQDWGCEECGNVFRPGCEIGNPEPPVPAVKAPETSLVGLKEKLSNLPEKQDDLQHMAVEKPGYVLHSSSYDGASDLILSPQEEEKIALYEDAPDDIISIRPEGQVYVSHIHYRKALSNVFGRGQWAMIPTTHPAPERVDKDGRHIVVFQGWKLLIRKKFVGDAVGSGSYWVNNPSQDKSDAIEAAKSNALARICSKSSLGIYVSPWEERFREDWIEKYAVQVWVKNPAGEQKKMWRRRDAKPFAGEMVAVEPVAQKSKIKSMNKEEDQTKLPSSVPAEVSQPQTQKPQPHLAETNKTTQQPSNPQLEYQEESSTKSPEVRMVGNPEWIAFMANMRRLKLVVGEDAERATSWFGGLINVEGPGPGEKPSIGILRRMFLRITYETYQKVIVKAMFEKRQEISSE